MLLKEILSYLFTSEHSYLITSNQKFPVSRMVLAGYWDSVCDCCSVTMSCLTLLTPWTAAPQAPLSFTISQSLSTESVMLSNQLILCYSLLLLPSIFPSIMFFSNELVLHIRWPKCWSFYLSISPSSEYSGLIFFRID